MHAFTRLTSFLLFVLSLSFLTCALPTPAAAGSNGLAVRNDACQGVLDILVELKAKVDVTTNALLGCGTLAEVTVQVDLLAGEVEAAAEAILAIGTHNDVGADIKANIAAEVAAIICVIVQACLSISLKFGLSVVLVICAKIDACIHLLLVNLGLCIEGIVVVIAKLVVGASADTLLKLDFKLCLSIFAILGF
ncbi:hypothetical protein FRC10_008660 [Ceratobasidium sp. 414]|nr:hypothetical protein FRC10_008660 [Ceratobasidium sp. 414]